MRTQSLNSPQIDLIWSHSINQLIRKPKALAFYHSKFDSFNGTCIIHNYIIQIILDTNDFWMNRKALIVPIWPKYIRDGYILTKLPPLSTLEREAEAEDLPPQVSGIIYSINWHYSLTRRHQDFFAMQHSCFSR